MYDRHGAELAKRRILVVVTSFNFSKRVRGKIKIDWRDDVIMRHREKINCRKISLGAGHQSDTVNPKMPPNKNRNTHVTLHDQCSVLSLVDPTRPTQLATEFAGAYC